MKLYREAPDRLLLIYRLIVGWYAIWFCVGLIFVGFNLPSLFGPIEDFLFIFLAAMVLLLDTMRRVSWPVALGAFFWVAIISGLIETLGAVTGFPFGSYQYTAAFGPQLFGVLPLAIPFAWWIIILPLHLVFARLADLNWYSSRLVVPFVGVSATFIDLALEPVATLERGYWLWQGPGFWYGVPWTNFLGWLGTSMLLSAGLKLLLGDTVRRLYFDRQNALMVPLLALLTVMLTFLLASLVAGFWLASGVAAVVVFALLTAKRRFGPASLASIFKGSL